MDLTTGSAIYLVIWWLVIFMVLPWGRRSSEPEKPTLARKLAATTVISGVIFGIFYWLAETGLVDFRAVVS